MCASHEAEAMVGAGGGGGVDDLRDPVLHLGGAGEVVPLQLTTARLQSHTPSGIALSVAANYLVLCRCHLLQNNHHTTLVMRC